MTVTMALAVTAPNTPARGAERGGKDAAAGGQRFDEALAVRPGPRDPAETGVEAADTRPALKPVGFGPRFDQAQGEPDSADPQAAPETGGAAGPADAAGEADAGLTDELPVPEAEAALLALEVLSGADMPRQPAVAAAPAATTAAGSGDARPAADDGRQARTGLGDDDALPARETRSRSDGVLPARESRLGDRVALPLREAGLRGSNVLPLRETGLRNDGPALPRETGLRGGGILAPREAGGRPAAPAAAPAASGQAPVQARMGNAPAPTAPAPTAQAAAPITPAQAMWRLEAAPPTSEAQPAGPAPGTAMQGAAPRPVFDTPGNNALAGGRMAARTDPSDTLAGRLNVLSLSTALPPAPAIVAPLPAATVTGLVSAMEADPSWRAAAAEAAAQTGQRGQGFTGAVSTLRIQLHPAELGMVTARLTVSGSQLSIEIQTESSDARQRLANDSEMIVKAMRAAGYDVDKVTIQQAPQGGGNGQQQGSAAGRDPFAANQQAQEEGNARQRGGRGEDAGEQRGSGHGGGEAAADRAGGGLYI